MKMIINVISMICLQLFLHISYQLLGIILDLNVSSQLESFKAGPTALFAEGNPSPTI